MKRATRTSKSRNGDTLHALELRLRHIETAIEVSLKALQDYQAKGQHLLDHLERLKMTRLNLETRAKIWKEQMGYK